MVPDNNHQDVRTSTAIILHILPALCIAASYLIFSRVAARFGLPHLTGLLAAFTLVGIPLQLGIMRSISRRIGHSVVHFRAARPFWQHLVGALALIALLFGALRLPLGGVSDYLATHIFSWVPAEFGPASDADLATTARSVLLPILILQLLIDGIINPLVEERYFRGFLLPQFSRLRIAAPIVNTLLFSFAHFWQPYNYVSIFVFVLPLTFFTWWRKNYYAQATVHCFANSYGAVLALISFFTAAPS